MPILASVTSVTVHVIHGKRLVKSPVKLSYIKLGC